MSKLRQREIETLKMEAVSHEERLVRPPSEDDIAARAYEIWQERGFPEGTAEEDWMEAERELTTMHGG